MSTNLTNSEGSFVPDTLNEITAREYAVKVLSSIYRFEEDSFYPAGYQKVTLGTIRNGTVFPTTSTREAQVALTDFYRKVGEYNIFGHDPSVGVMRTLTRKPARDANPLNTPYISANYKKFNPDATATYPVISVSEAP